MEKQLSVDQILVVTFTNAATEELKDRIRNRLVQTRTAFDTMKMRLKPAICLTRS
ncbi:MAG: UvrD-helicase domain-containing protein [Desulfobacterales bacterium]|nr:MAG: UvrD-helicase domain-containing protein [Desulfobacterales bacterium]